MDDTLEGSCACVAQDNNGKRLKITFTITMSVNPFYGLTFYQGY